MLNLRRYATAWSYIVALAVAEAAFVLLPHGWQARVVRWASTNVHNLQRHPLVSIVASAFVPASYLLICLALSAVGLLALNGLIGNLRTAVLVVCTHIAGTLVSEAIVFGRFEAGAVHAAALHQIDTGTSYVMVPALVLGVVFGSWRARLLCGAGLAMLAPFLFEGLLDWDVTAIGHTTAIALAVPLFLWLRGNGRVSAPRLAALLPAAGAAAGSAR